MKFTIEYPVSAPDYDPALVGPEGMRRVVQAADELGFHAVAFTEHPAPSLKWLNAGGHESLDLTGALSFCAAVTSRIRLMTYLMVLPYHNPFVAAKALTTVDLLSKGRVSVVVGTGYLRSEFLALNVDMELRNEIFDEALEVIRGVWTQAPYTHDGAHFHARGVAQRPGPVEAGGPPVLIGGNSARARSRAARNQGWSPMMVSEQMARTTRTPSISTVEELGRHITGVRERAVREQGEGAHIEVQVQAPASRFMIEPDSVEEHRDFLGRLGDAGADSIVLQPPGDSVEAATAALHEYAENFVG